MKVYSTSTWYGVVNGIVRTNGFHTVWLDASERDVVWCLCEQVCQEKSAMHFACNSKSNKFVQLNIGPPTLLLLRVCLLYRCEVKHVCFVKAIPTWITWYKIDRSMALFFYITKSSKMSLKSNH